MDQKPTRSMVIPQYLLISVEKVDPLPAWLPAGNWYRYIIRQGDSDTEGYLTGTLPSVQKHAETVTADLNERVTNRKYSALRSKGKPATPPDKKNA